MAGGTRWLPAMRLALDEAARAASHGDVPIGAVLLDADGAVLASAGNERELTGDPTAHAEVLVLRRGAQVLRQRAVEAQPGSAQAGERPPDAAGAGLSQPDHPLWSRSHARSPKPLLDGDAEGRAAAIGGQAGAVRAAAPGASGDGWRLDDCTLVVTLEPCTMCAGAIVHARLKRLVFGAFDEKAGAVSSIRDVVRDPRLNHRVEVTAGVCADEASALLRTFFAAQR